MKSLHEVWLQFSSDECRTTIQRTHIHDKRSSKDEGEEVAEAKGQRTKILAEFGFLGRWPTCNRSMTIKSARSERSDSALIPPRPTSDASELAVLQLR